MNTTKITTEQIDALLPQTQCRECGYAGCKPYALALTKGEAKINLCPPGGVSTLKKLGKLLDIDATPYLTQLTKKYRPPSIAYINEELCIGCVKCINTCPVDAIVGAAKLMHTVITDECTGCELCVPVCPMDCIELHPVAPYSSVTKEKKATQWRQRYENRNTRITHNKQTQQQQHENAKLKQTATSRTDKQAEIAAAIARSMAKRDRDHE